jgi:hypothetical protein
MNNKKIIAIALLIVIGTVVFWKREWIKQKLGLNKEADSQSSTNSNSTKSNEPKSVTPGITYIENDTFPFKLGDKGTRVKAIQIALNKFHGESLQTDGYFGPLTESALVKAGFGKTLEDNEVTALLKKK